MGDETANSYEERFSGLVGLKAIDLQQRIFLWSHLHGNPEWLCWQFRLGAFDKGLSSFDTFGL
jgi:hypothetical protein